MFWIFGKSLLRNAFEPQSEESKTTWIKSLFQKFIFLNIYLKLLKGRKMGLVGNTFELWKPQAVCDGKHWVKMSIWKIKA
jgi:hypothetical protein